MKSKKHTFIQKDVIYINDFAVDTFGESQRLNRETDFQRESGIIIM